MSLRPLLITLLLSACSSPTRAPDARSGGSSATARITNCDEDTGVIPMSQATPLSWDFKGATWPGLNGDEVHDDPWGEDHIDESFAIMDELGMTGLRLRAWRDWTPDELEEVLTAADAHGISVALVLSHKEHSFIDGYPHNVERSASDLDTLLDLVQPHPSVQAFDLRAEPFTPPDENTAQEERDWLTTIASLVKAEDHHYGVFTNLTQNHLPAIPAIIGFSDLLVVNFYFPRGMDLGGEYNGEYVPPCVYRSRLGEHLAEYLEEVDAYNSADLPVMIGQFGAYMGERAGLPYTDEEGQAAFYSAFFTEVTEHPEVTGGALFVLADADGGFAVVNNDGTRKQACDVITEAYRTED